MAVKELTLASTERTDTTWEQQAERLSQQGFALLGEGTFSKVFSDPNNPRQVVKLMRLRGNTNSLKWLNWCKVNPSVYVPKVADIKVYTVHGGDPYAQVVLERLDMGASREQISKWAQEVGVEEHIVFTRASQPEIQILPNIEDYDKNLELKRVMLQIIKTAGGRNSNQDISAENLARRTTGELVFVDPLTGD